MAASKKTGKRAQPKRKPRNVAGNPTMFPGKPTSLLNRIPSAGLDNLKERGNRRS